MWSVESHCSPGPHWDRQCSWNKLGITHLQMDVWKASREPPLHPRGAVSVHACVFQYVCVHKCVCVCVCLQRQFTVYLNLLSGFVITPLIVSLGSEATKQTLTSTLEFAKGFYWWVSYSPTPGGSPNICEKSSRLRNVCKKQEEWSWNNKKKEFHLMLIAEFKHKSSTTWKRENCAD